MESISCAESGERISVLDRSLKRVRLYVLECQQTQSVRLACKGGNRQNRSLFDEHPADFF